MLGGYELVRTVDQRLREPSFGSSRAAESSLPRARIVKAQFERVRVPLAKFEPARRYTGDSLFAQPGLNPARAVGWWVNADEFIERRQLGDAPLELLEEIAAAFGPYPVIEVLATVANWEAVGRGYRGASTGVAGSVRRADLCVRPEQPASGDVYGLLAAGTRPLVVGAHAPPTRRRSVLAVSGDRRD